MHEHKVLDGFGHGWNGFFKEKAPGRATIGKTMDGRRGDNSPVHVAEDLGGGEGRERRGGGLHVFGDTV